jgi:hypothetical protein
MQRLRWLAAGVGVGLAYGILVSLLLMLVVDFHDPNGDITLGFLQLPATLLSWAFMVPLTFLLDLPSLGVGRPIALFAYAVAADVIAFGLIFCLFGPLYARKAKRFAAKPKLGLSITLSIIFAAFTALSLFAIVR